MGERIKELRKFLGLTQQEFAAKIGSNQNNITNYETGRRTPSSAAVNNMCKTFGVSEEWLRTGEGEMIVPVTPDENIAAFVGEVLAHRDDNFKKRFINMLSSLDEKQWELLEMLVKEMTKSGGESDG
ncbi:MAG: helix-turn-helix transcriptional regulator [Oscillospiraceae bacterium]|nr:helix-turn-helix domain-containing protein [Oscillospiraceae bacterium]MDY3065976.1 helix-turn-helix transcriptional regulator [Oscillospiraceae bacterium]